MKPIIAIASLIAVVGCTTPKRIADPLPPVPVYRATPDAIPMFAGAQPPDSIPCITRWGKPCGTNSNVYTGRAVITWTESAPVFEYEIFTSTNARLPVALWTRFTNTTAHSIPITTTADAQRFFYVRWTNTIDKSSGYVL